MTDSTTAAAHRNTVDQMVGRAIDLMIEARRCLAVAYFVNRLAGDPDAARMVSETAQKLERLPIELKANATHEPLPKAAREEPTE